MITTDHLWKTAEAYEHKIRVLHKIGNKIPTINWRGDYTPAYKVIKEEIESLEEQRGLLLNLIDNVSDPTKG